MADVVVVVLEMGDERLPDEESCDDEEDVDAMGHGHVGETVEGRVEQDSLGVALHHAKNGESPQEVQSKDSFPINIDAPKVLHGFWLLTSTVHFRCGIQDTVCACKNRNKGATKPVSAWHFPP